MQFPRRFVLAAALAGAAMTAFAMPTVPGTREEAKALAEKALAHVKKVGFDQAVKDFTADQATWGLASRGNVVYVYAYDFNGVNLAHSVNAAVVGKNLIGIKGPDGKASVADAVALMKGGSTTGWNEFKWSNPATKKVAPGVSYLIRVPGKDAYIGAHAFLE